MIRVTRLNNSEILVNADLIEHVEVTADTVVALTNGTSFVVKESAEQILEKVIQYKQQCHSSVLPVRVEQQTA